MPSSIVSSHVSTDNRSDGSREITMAKPRSQQPAIHPTDSENVVSEAAASKRRIHKQSWDYVVRSGTAGGLAACAVGLLENCW